MAIAGSCPRVLRAATCSVMLLASATPLASQSREPRQVQFADLLPADLRVAQLVFSADTTRAYVITPVGEIWFYDRLKNTSTRLGAGEAWDLSLAAGGTAIAYTRAGVKKTDRSVWVQPLDPRTGLAIGAERRVSPGASDAPAISPDARSLAFARDDATGVGQSVVVVPLAGGPERVVLRSMPGSVGSIRWTPDGKTLYIGMNPPVPCDPDWSCLALKTDAQPRRGSFIRVPAAGGSATAIAAPTSVWPGLSPDGTALVFPDTGRNRVMLLADPSGRPLQSFTLPTGATLQGWIGTSTLLTSVPRTRWRLHRYSLADGAHAVMIEGTDPITDPALSPDGTMLSLVQCTSTPCHLRITGLDGVLRRDVALPEQYLGGNTWSPDQHWLASVTRTPDGMQHINAIETATGRVTRLGDLPAGNRPMLLWLADSRTLGVTQDRVVGQNERHTMFHQFDVSGKHRELRDISFGTAQAGALPLDGNSALIYRLVTGQPNQMPSLAFARQRLDSAGSEQGFPLPTAYYYPPTLSFDRDWLAFRTATQGTDSGTVVEMMRMDGTGRRTVTAPFVAAFAQDNPLVLARGEQLLLRENSLPNREAAVYLAAVGTGRLTKLFTIPANERASQFVVSADGKTLMYLTAESIAPRFVGIEIGEAMRSR